MRVSYFVFFTMGHRATERNLDLWESEGKWFC